jgi:hypothetical protein
MEMETSFFQILDRFCAKSQRQKAAAIFGNVETEEPVLEKSW